MKVATLQSQDLVSRRDLSAAYRFLGITGWEVKSISDERIIEKYQAQQPDFSAQSQEEARSHLGKIAIARNSTLLLNASRQSVDTYEDALSWLGNGVDKNTSDEGLLAVLSIKVSRALLPSWSVRRCLATETDRACRPRKAKPTKKSARKPSPPLRRPAKAITSTTSSSPAARTDTQ
jgi:hypothetical protein